MSLLQAAIELAEKGFHIFPLIEDSKLPAIDAFPLRATRDLEQIKSWWVDSVMGWERSFNIGISTSRFGDNEALLVIDVDNKGDKNGDQEIIRLELEGKPFPTTYTQTTPTGGRHLIYRVPEAVKQGVNVLGRGLDTRSRGGYIVGFRSRVEGGTYAAGSGDIVAAPEWLVSCLAHSPEREATENPHVIEGVDRIRACDRARLFLELDAPVSRQGEGGDQTAYGVAARIKDFGINRIDAVELLAEVWNPRCEPPWSLDEIKKKVANAYRYGSSPVGVSAPETQFQPIENQENKEAARMHPFQELNKEYAFVVSGGKSHILWETIDPGGRFALRHLDTDTFHKKFAPDKISSGDRSQPLSEMWMKSHDRRSYDGICFMPGLEAPKRFYNLWRGFAVEPLGREESGSSGDQAALQMFLEHARDNVCGGDESLYQWLIGYFAHLVQKPWEKPLVALVFRGKKGVGKNALINIIGHLLGHHYMLTSNRRYMLGNFNGHLENLLLFVLDEAFWSGDKQAEGVLKDLITGNTHIIEHKGQSSYEVANRARIVIIGNEKWLVPASEDERRFAVFDVGDARKQDRSFFKRMREGMEAGGYRLLLRHLLSYDISKTDTNDAPQTAALLDQKINSLDPFYQWWFSCISEGHIGMSDFGKSWPEEIDKDHFRTAFKRHCRDHQISGRIPNDVAIGKLLRKCLPDIDSVQKRTGPGDRAWFYKMPLLVEARLSWNEFIGHSVDWSE